MFFVKIYFSAIKRFLQIDILHNVDFNAYKY